MRRTLVASGRAMLLAGLLFVPCATAQEADNRPPCVPATANLQALAERLNRFWGVRANLLVCDGERVKFGANATPGTVYFVPKEARDVGLDDELGTAFIIAHEWGHQVQFERLRLQSAFSFNQQREFQADCLAGYFIGATFLYSPDTERRLMAATGALGEARGIHEPQFSGPLGNVRAYYVQRGYRDGRQHGNVGCTGTTPIKPTLDIEPLGQAKVPATENEAEMVLVPAGEFWMGSEDDSRETPPHRIYLDAFYIDTYEVNNVLYRRFMETTGRAAPLYWSDAKWNSASQPVVGVSWYDADAYCKWAGKRLPTEAEWEKAARGTDGRKFPWGETWDSSRANSRESKLDRTVAVGSYPGGVSPFGAYDMAGNVWEWVADWYDDAYYKRGPDHNPHGPDSGGLHKVLRGGSWLNLPPSLRTTNRNQATPVYRSQYIGFRCTRGPS
jgi:formylglycine-generating enzyme required for sulfatase activity